jgi:acyl-coenzyme A synthetase/AMP-(fatty) acid ligase
LWRLGAIHVPLFTAFGAEAVGYRVSHSGARIVVTNAANRSKVGPSDTISGSGDKKSLEVVVVEDSDGVISPGDQAGLAPGALRITPDGKSYAYTADQGLSVLQLVEGLK